jgi:hypothetical protein
MSNYSFNITPLVFWVTSWNSRSKYVKKVKSNVVPRVRSLVLILLYYNLIYIYHNQICLCLLYFRLNQRLIICFVQFVLVLVVLLLVVVHLFVDLLMFVPGTATLMWLVFAIVIVDLTWCEFSPAVVALMLDQFDPPIPP